MIARRAWDALPIVADVAGLAIVAGAWAVLFLGHWMY